MSEATILLVMATFLLGAYIVVSALGTMK